jgi:hypothetical protein
LSFINFKQIWYVYIFLKKINFWLMLTLFLHWGKHAFRDEDLDAVACKPIRIETLCVLRGFSEMAKQKTVIAVWNDLDSERSLLLSSSVPNWITEINFVLSAHKNCTDDLISETIYL